MTALFLSPRGTLRPNRRNKAYGPKHAMLAAGVKRRGNKYGARKTQIDGIWTEEHERALLFWQGSVGLAANGILDEPSTVKMGEVIAFVSGEASGAAPPTPGPAPQTQASAGGAPPPAATGAPAPAAAKPGDDGLNAVPGGGQLWQVGADWYVVYMVPGTEVPMAWKVDDVAAVAGPGVWPTARRTFASEEELRAAGALVFGNSRELANMSEHPFDGFVELFGKEAEIRPWLRDPEIAALHAMAALEGRALTDAEIQTTDWWQSHNAQERSWILAAAADPASARLTVDDNRRAWRDKLVAAGISNPPDTLVNWIADRVTAGTWSQSKAAEQVLAIANPHAGIELDSEIVPLLQHVESKHGALQTLAGDIRGVRTTVERWLGPALASGWTDAEIERWAGKLAVDPQAALELEETLRGQRLAAFPEYADERLTYESIAAPWRSVFMNVWGQPPDELDPLFAEIVRTNDRAAAEERLRDEGLRRGVGYVVDRALQDTGAAMGGGIRRVQ